LNVTKWSVSYLLLTLFIFISLAVPVFAFAQDQTEREVVVLAINDVYRIEGVEGRQRGGMSLVRALRRQLEQQSPDLLFLHAGDFLFPSLISEWTKCAHIVVMMNSLDGAPGVHDSRMFVVLGNHEFDRSKQKHAALLQARIDQSEFQWLGTNIRFAQEAGEPLVASDNLKVSNLVESGGVRVGIFGLTTDKRPASKIAYVDEFIDPVLVAMEQTKLLREQGAEVVIALTHLSLKKDREILEKLGDRGPHLIIGGHEHQRHHVEINGRWILKADADARTATVARIQMIGQRPFISFGYRFLDRDRLSPDPEMQKRVDQVLNEHEEWFCSDHNEDADCLQRAVGETAVPLIGEELEIRSYETNLGNWVADQVRAVVEDADIAFINAGSLRMNQDIPAGPITQRDLEELLPYNSELVRVELDNNQLDQILKRATEGWSGKGHWLQISGFAFQHDPRKGEGHRVDAISLLQDGKMMKLPDRPLQAVTYKFLIEGGDGYDMLKPLQWLSVAGSLKERLRQILRASKEPIQPRVDGRICNLAEIGKRPCAFKDISNK
jgi:2',3'-cyclic-nucleotide 2'-phosphodiesterase (5'-nucleotidase family)